MFPSVDQTFRILKMCIDTSISSSFWLQTQKDEPTVISDSVSESGSDSADSVSTVDKVVTNL